MILVVLFWGVNYSAIKGALPLIPPLAFAALRFGAGSLFLAWALARGEGLRLPPPPLRRPLVWLGLLGNTGYQLCFMLGLARTSATNTSLLLAAMPTLVTAVAAALGLEQFSTRRILALLLATVGVVSVVVAGSQPGRAGNIAGDLLILAGVLCWTGYTIGLRRIGRQMSPLALTSWATFTGTPGLLLAGAPALVDTAWGRVSSTAWAGLAYSTLASLVAAYVLYSDAVQRLGAGRTVLYTCATPLVATAAAVLALGEQPTWGHLAGGVLIAAGVVLGRGEG
jgi:drug/metabolite transporter (DMT)-like permease